MFSALPHFYCVHCHGEVQDQSRKCIQFASGSDPYVCAKCHHPREGHRHLDPVIGNRLQELEILTQQLKFQNEQFKLQNEQFKLQAEQLKIQNEKLTQQVEERSQSPPERSISQSTLRTSTSSPTTLQILERSASLMCEQRSANMSMDMSTEMMMLTNSSSSQAVENQNSGRSMLSSSRNDPVSEHTATELIPSPITPKRPKILTKHTGAVSTVAIHPSEQYILSGGGDNVIRMWSLENFQETGVLKRSHWVLALAFSADGALFAAGEKTSKVNIWNTKGWKKKTSFQIPKATRINDVKFSPSGALFFAASDRGLAIWDLKTEKRLFSLDSQDVSCLVVRADSAFVYAANSSLALHEGDKFPETCVFSGHSSQVYCTALSPDGSLLASGGRDSTVRIWDALTGTEKLCYTGQEKQSQVFCLDFHPKFLVASGGDGKTIRIWDCRTGEDKLLIEGHESGVTSLKFAKNGNYLISTSFDKTVRIWDLQGSL